MHISISLARWWSIRILALSLFLFCLILPRDAAVAATSAGEASASTAQTEHVILFVLEGFSQDSLKGGTMPTLSRLVKDGSVAWSATAVKPALRLPTMASLITGMTVEKHGITRNDFECSRGYTRAPSVFY
ncbi:MAG: alkaline phosphatase family protein [Nitrospirae bacterium]|nr:alkaline phosphatase family protein [Nitrospirota bacterium]